MADPTVTGILQQGIETAKAGNKLLARLHLSQAVELAPNDPNCWLWLAWVADSPLSAVHSLRRILDQHPNHKIALAGLKWAQTMADFELAENVSEETSELEQREAEQFGEIAERDDTEQQDDSVDVVDIEVREHLTGVELSEASGDASCERHPDTRLDETETFETKTEESTTDIAESADLAIDEPLTIGFETVDLEAGEFETIDLDAGEFETFDLEADEFEADDSATIGFKADDLFGSDGFETDNFQPVDFETGEADVELALDDAAAVEFTPAEEQPAEITGETGFSVRRRTPMN